MPQILPYVYKNRDNSVLNIFGFTVAGRRLFVFAFAIKVMSISCFCCLLVFIFANSKSSKKYAA